MVTDYSDLISIEITETVKPDANNINPTGAKKILTVKPINRTPMPIIPIRSFVQPKPKFLWINLLSSFPHLGQQCTKPPFLLTFLPHTPKNEVHFKQIYFFSIIFSYASVDGI